MVYVFLEHTTLYHLNWQMLSPCSHNCGNPSFWKSWGIVTESISHLIVLSLVKWWTLVSELASIVHFLRILQCHLVMLCCTFFFSGILSLRYFDTNWIWISVRYDGWDNFSRVITLVPICPGKVMSCLAHRTRGPSVIVSFVTRLIIFPWGNWMPV